MQIKTTCSNTTSRWNGYEEGLSVSSLGQDGDQWEPSHRAGQECKHSATQPDSSLWCQPMHLAYDLELHSQVLIEEKCTLSAPKTCTEMPRGALFRTKDVH